MHNQTKSLWILGCLGMAIATATPSLAQSYSDITGTNVWNSVPVMLDNGEELDPELVTRVQELNEISAIAFEECTVAIAEIEELYKDVPQRFSREDLSPPPPPACVTLEESRTEMAQLRVQLEQLEIEIAENNSFTW